MALGLTIGVPQLVACSPVDRLVGHRCDGVAACDLACWSPVHQGSRLPFLGGLALDPCLDDFTLAHSTLSAWSFGELQLSIQYTCGGSLSFIWLMGVLFNIHF